MKVLWLGCCLLALGASAPGQDTRDLDKRVTDFTLANGLRFVLMERHQAPVISFHTYVGGGSVNDPAGKTGLAFLVGRMGFKGTESVGSRNWADERKALDALDEAGDRMEAERNKGPRMNQELFEKLRSQWRLAVDAAQRLSDSADYARILQENGAAGARAGTTRDALHLACSLPSNRLELWFAMESQRLMHPVIRDFDQERNALIDEQSKARDNPQTRVIETLLATAFLTHPYRIPDTGWPADLPELKRSDARDFLAGRLSPGNIVIAMAGDVDPAEVRRLAEKYFGPMPARPMPDQMRTVEPPQQGPRIVQLDLPGPVMTAIGYKRPSYFDKDDPAVDVLQAILGNGTSGLAWRELVQERKAVSTLRIVSSYPDGRYPNLFIFFAAPAAGQSAEQVQKALDELVAHMRSQKVGLDALNDAKAQTQAREYQRLTSNADLAEMLALHTAAFGDWKKLFTLIDDVAKVTEDDVLRVAQRYLVPANRTAVFTANPVLPARPPRGGGPQ